MESLALASAWNQYGALDEIATKVAHGINPKGKEDARQSVMIYQVFFINAKHCISSAVRRYIIKPLGLYLIKSKIGSMHAGA